MLRSTFDKQDIMKMIIKIRISIMGNCELFLLKQEYTSNFQSSNELNFIPRKNITMGYVEL